MISPDKMMTFLCRNVIWKDWREKREQLSNISRCNAQPTSAPFPFYYTQDWLRTVSSLLQDFIHCLGHDFLYFSNQFLLCQYEASTKKLHLPFTSTHLKLDLSYPSKIEKIHSNQWLSTLFCPYDHSVYNFIFNRHKHEKNGRKRVA